MAAVLPQALMSNQRGILSGAERGGNISNSNSTSISVSGVPIGTSPSPYRTVVVTAQHNGTFVGLKINGVSIPSSQRINTSTQAIGWEVVNTGTTCSIGLDVNSGGNFRFVYAYTLLDGFRTLHDYQSGSSVTLALPGDESYIIGIGGGTSTNPTWTNLTTRVSAVSSVSSIYSESGSDFVTTGTTRAISISSGDFLVASFR